MLRHIEEDKKNNESMAEKINSLQSDVEDLRSQIDTLTVQNQGLNKKYKSTLLQLKGQGVDRTAPPRSKAQLGKVL